MLMMRTSLKALSPALSHLHQPQTQTTSSRTTRSPMQRCVCLHHLYIIITNALQLAMILPMKTVPPHGGNTNPDAHCLHKKTSSK
jgi:hypothetical protein